jgi:RND family efflux transporter MFP subunit
MLNKKKILAFSALLLLILASLAVVIIDHEHKIVSLPKNVVAVQLGTVKISKVPNTYKTTGTLEPIQQADLSVESAGYINKIHFKDGDYVKKGQVLIELGNDTQKDAVASAKAALALSKLNYQRALKLYHSKFYSKHAQALETARANVAKNQAALQTAVTNLGFKTVTAPFSGYLGAKMVSPGDNVQPEQKLVTITELDKLRAEYSIPARYQARIKLHQPVQITAANVGNKHFAGDVSFIAPTIDETSQTINEHATIKNKNLQLKPGDFINITQTLGPPKKALIIPAASLMESLNGNYVYKVKNKRAIRTPVKVGEKFRNSVEILSGLKAGDKIVIAGQDQLHNGSRVKVVS